jgi:hypothetical protein
MAATKARTRDPRSHSECMPINLFTGHFCMHPRSLVFCGAMKCREPGNYTFGLFLSRGSCQPGFAEEVAPAANASDPMPFEHIGDECRCGGGGGGRVHILCFARQQMCGAAFCPTRARTARAACLRRRRMRKREREAFRVDLYWRIVHEI